jgi:hypothetical protein
MESPVLLGHRQYKGAVWNHTNRTYDFSMTILGNSRNLGSYLPADADSGARRFDALQLLLLGPRAETNFAWGSYSQADIARVAECLKDGGVDVELAVADTKRWVGSVSRTGQTWRAYAEHNDKGNRISFTRGNLQTAAAAAWQVDCWMLPLKGVACTTAKNFPASRYTQQQLKEAGELMISKGVRASLVNGNLEAIEKVRCFQLASTQ